mgnify:CR=1 FL=1
MVVALNKNLLLQLNLQDQLIVLENLDREKSSEVLISLQGSPSILGNIVQQMSPDRLSDVIEDMPQDDAADFVGLLDDDKADALLEKLLRSGSPNSSCLQTNGNDPR